MEKEELFNMEKKTEKMIEKGKNTIQTGVCCCSDKTEDKEDDGYVSVPLSVRLRNWPVWIALLGSLGIILNSFGVFAKLGLDTDAWNTIVNAIGGIFIALGVVNNPTDLKHF